jgi:hypothetical protein
MILGREVYERIHCRIGVIDHYSLAVRPGIGGRASSLILLPINAESVSAVRPATPSGFTVTDQTEAGFLETCRGSHAHRLESENGRQQQEETQCTPWPTIISRGWTGNPTEEIHDSRALVFIMKFMRQTEI